MISIKRIFFDNSDEIRRFIEIAGTSLNSFRYFKTRDISVIRNHIVTALVFEDELPIAYGHLDAEANQIWLGIAVIDKMQGKGIGTMMMNYLIQNAEDRSIKKLSLSVDKDNFKAITLYRKFGFSDVTELKENVLLMERCNF